MRLSAANIQAGYNGRPVLHDMCIDVPAGGLVGIIGPNGSGKSTLLKVLGRLMAPSAGSVQLDGRDVNDMPRRAFAQALAILPQQPAAPMELSVRQLVQYGRYPHIGRFHRFTAHDRDCIDGAIAECGLDDLADRPLGALSGGERQRAWIAMTLAQQPRVLLLDEPLSFLDIHHQFDVLQLLERLNGERRITIVAVMHDLALAGRYFQQLALIDRGRLMIADAPQYVLESEAFRRAFRVDCRFSATEHGRAIDCQFAPV